MSSHTRTEMPPWNVRRTTEADWSTLRTFRLAQAAEHPISYGATVETTGTFTEAAWRLRAGRGDRPDAASYIAYETTSDRWIGTIAAEPETGHDSALITGVYVTPDQRGAGVAATLLGAIEAWARQHTGTLRLLVHDGSSPAIRLYLRHGFTFTGHTEPAMLYPALHVLEMTKTISTSASHDLGRLIANS